MESAYESMRRDNSTLHSNKDMRMTQRPAPTNDFAFEDLGSDFAHRSSTHGGRTTRSRGKLSQGKGTSQKSSQISTKKPRLSDFDEDTDELDIISAGPSTKTSSRTSTSNRRAISERNSESTDHNAAEIMVDGQLYRYDRDIEIYEQRSNDLKGMKFKKNSGTAGDSPSSSNVATPRVGTHSASAVRSGVGTKAASAPFKPPTMMRPPGGQGVSSGSPRGTAIDRGQYKELENTADSMATPRADMRPKPRPIRDTSEPEHRRITRQSRRQPAPFPMDGVSPPKEKARADFKGKSRARESSLEDDSEAPVIQSKSKPRAFPTEHLSPLQSKAGPRDFPMSPPRKGQSTRNRTSPGLQSPSPLTSPDSSDKELPATAATTSSKPLAPFPALSPLSSPARKNSARSEKRSETHLTDRIRTRPKRQAAIAARRIVSESDGTDVSDDCLSHSPPTKKKKKKKPALQPFPMETQVLASIDRTRRKSSEGVLIVSDEDDHHEARNGGRPRDGDQILRELMWSNDMSGSDEEMFMNPDVDPSTLCPWCDEPLPPAPSPLLQRLMMAARGQSFDDPRLSNPHGLHAPATVFVNVCHRHQFEKHHFPLAQQRGWPTEIEWDMLSKRVVKLRSRLQAIVDDVDEDFEPGRERPQGDSDEDKGEDAKDDEFLLDYRPRKGSLFWIEVVRSVRKRGSKNAAGVHAQMSNFSKTQPGYYGELGAMILSQTLYDMFPPLNFPANSTLPLTPADFVQRVLLPEAALSLIMEDMQETRQSAIATMRASAQYGVAMFPDDNTDEAFAGETVVKKRAEARRKQLEREDRASHLNGHPSSSNTSDRGSATLSESTTLIAKRRNIGRKATMRKYAESDSDDEDVRMKSDSTLSDNFKAKKPRSKRVIKKVDKAPPDVIVIPDTPTSSLPTKPRPKPRPRAKDGFGSDTGHDTELEFPTTTDDERLTSQQSLSSQRHIQFRSKGKAKVSVRSEDGTWLMDANATPKPSKRTKETLSRASSVSDFGLRIEPSVVVGASSSREAPPTTSDFWSSSLRDDFGSDEEM